MANEQEREKFKAWLDFQVENADLPDDEYEAKLKEFKEESEKKVA